MLKQEEIVKKIEKDRDKKRTVSLMVDDLAGRAKEAIQKKVEQFKKKIDEIIEKKNDLLNVPFTRAETLEMAKEALRENRKRLFDEFLVKHLRDCQMRQDVPLRPSSVLNYFFRDGASKLAYWIVTEKDLEEAAKELPSDVGLSENERDAQIQKIDTEIAALEGQIERELKKL